MCSKAVRREPRSLAFVPDQYKTQGMCDKAVEKDPWPLEKVPDNFKTQEMCKKAVEKVTYAETCPWSS